MSAPTCERCGTMVPKTYWVGDKEWLCVDCFKQTKGSK